jgi:hypothetical protein
MDGALVFFLRTFPRIINLKKMIISADFATNDTLCPGCLPAFLLSGVGEKRLQANWEPETLCTSCLIAL